MIAALETLSAALGLAILMAVWWLAWLVTP